MENSEEIVPQDLTNEQNIIRFIEEINTTRGKEKSFRYAILENLFKAKLLVPEEFLSLAIQVSNREEDLPILFVCLDYIANKDFYIEDENKGNTHILVFASSVITDLSMLSLFLHIMILKGCDPLSSAFKNNSTVKSESVFRWYQANKSMTIPQTQTQALDSIENLSELGQQIVNIGFSLNDNYDFNYIDVFIVCRVNFIKKIDINNVNKLLIKTFHAIMKDVFIECLDYFRPSYLEICYLVSHFVRVKKIRNSEYLVEDLRIMLNEIVKRGVEVDDYIISEISNVDPLCGSVLKESYERPLWQKISYNKSDGYIPKKLRDVSLFFGFDNEEDKETLCNFFFQLASGDEETIVRNYYEKNMILQSSRLVPGINKVSNNIKIENTTSFRSKPFEYPEIMTFFYRERGLNYGFLSSNFDIIVRSGKNPITGNSLKKHSIDEIKNKIAFLKENKMELSSVKSIREIIQKFKSPEILNRDKTNSIVDEMSRKIETKGYSKDDILSENINSLENIFSLTPRYYFSYNQKLNRLNQLNLSEDFIFLVFCISLYENF